MRPPASSHASNCTRRRLLRALAAGAGGSLLVDTGLARGRRAQQQSGTVEEVWVETDTDTDDTGVPDRVHVELLRPSDSGPDRQVPVVLRPAPYRGPYEGFVSPEEIPELPAYADGSGGEDGVAANAVELYNPVSDDGTRPSAGRTVPAPSDLFSEGIGRESGFPSELIEEAVPYESELLEEGYAFGYVAPPGTGLSTGCSTLGGPAEVGGVVAAIDWLNGRRTGYDTREGGDPVDAPWTDGTTGLFGESYRGALANAAATVDPGGLETVVSMRSLSNWYTYLRSGGAAIWPSNNGPSEATTLASLGLTVTTREGAQRCADRLGEIAERTDRETGNYNEFWATRNYLPEADNVSASVLLVHGLYDTNTRPREFAQFLDALDTEVPYNVWLHQGGHDDPIDRHEDAWLDRLLAWYDHWLKGVDNGITDKPPAVVERADGTLAEYGDWPDPAMEPVSLAARPGGPTAGGLAFDPPAEPTTESLVDNSELSPTEFLDVEGQHNDHRLVYRTDELESSLRVSGTVRPELTLSFDSETALVSGALVDYGETATIVNRGWTNPLNRDSLRESKPLEPGVAYDIAVPLQPVDYVFEPGHRLGFVLYASDYDVTKRPPSDPELTLHLQESRVTVPVVGGADGLAAALSEPSDDGSEENGNNGNGGNDDTSNGDTGDGTASGVDGDGAGLGVASAVAGLGGLGYLLWHTGDSEK